MGGQGGSGVCLCPSPTLASRSDLDWWGLGMLRSFSKTGIKMPFPDLEGGGCFRWYHRAPATCLSSGVGAGSPPRHWGGLSDGLLQLFLGPAYASTSVLCDSPSSIPPQFTLLISVSNVSSQKSLFFNVFCLQFIINHHFFKHLGVCGGHSPCPGSLQHGDAAALCP